MFYKVYDVVYDIVSFTVKVLSIGVLYRAYLFLLEWQHYLSTFTQ